MFSQYKYHFYLLASGVCYSSLSLFSALLSGQKIDPFTQILYRAAFGAAGSSLVLLVVFRQSLRISRRELKYLLLNALLLVGGFSTFITSIYLGTPVAKAIALVYAYPLSIVPLSFIFLRDKPTGKQLAALGLSLISVMLLLEVWTIKNPAEISSGEILAFANSIFYSGIVIYGRIMRTRTDLHPTKTVTYSLLFLIPLLFLLGSILNTVGLPILKPVLNFNYSWENWAGLFGLGFFGTTLAMTFLYLGLGKIKPLVAGVLLLTEPLWVTIWGFLIFGQGLGLYGILGILGILASVLLI